MTTEVEPDINNQPEDEVSNPISDDFVAKCMSKCSQYRVEAKKEKTKRDGFREEIRQEFGDSPIVQKAIASMDNRVEEIGTSVSASLPSPGPSSTE